MSYEITISGIDTKFRKCIDWVFCKVDTPATSNAKSNFVGNYMNISGLIGTDEATIDLYKWSILPVNDSKVFRNVQLTIKDADDNIIEKVSFPNAFVQYYRESYTRDKGLGKFDLQLKQKIDKNSYVEVNDAAPTETVKNASQSKIVESVLGKTPTSILDSGTSKHIDEFAGMLRGEKVQLAGVKTQEIKYVKRNPEETEKLRKVFDSTERKKFLQHLAEDVEKLKNAGLSDSDIARMNDGLNPKGWQVHHKLPLDDGGTNDMDNLILIKNEPFHKTITNFQNVFAKQLNTGEAKIVKWPIPDGNIYPPNN